MKAQQPNTKPSKVDLLLALENEGGDYLITVTPDQARSFLKQADKYNRIPNTIEFIVDEITAITPRAFDNSDNLKVLSYKIGNEGSRVVYLTVKNTLSQRFPKEFDWEAYESKLAQIARKFGADEFHIVERNAPHKLTVRLWWD